MPAKLPEYGAARRAAKNASSAAPTQADHQRLPVLDIGRQPLGDLAHMLRRRRHQQKVAIGHLVQPRGRLDRRVQLDAGQIDLIAVALIDVGQRLGLRGPDQHVAPGPARGNGERGAHAPAPTMPTD